MEVKMYYDEKQAFKKIVVQSKSYEEALDKMTHNNQKITLKYEIENYIRINGKYKPFDYKRAYKGYKASVYDKYKSATFDYDNDENL